MGFSHFIVMLLAGVAALLLSWGKLPIKKAWLKHLSPSSLKIIHFLGWTLVMFSFYDRYINYILGQ